MDAKTKICREIMATKDVVNTQAQALILEAFTNKEDKKLAKALLTNLSAIMEIQVSSLIDRVNSVEINEKKPTTRRRKKS